MKNKLTNNINIKSEHGIMSYMVDYFSIKEYINKKNIILVNSGNNSLQFQNKNYHNLKKYDLYWEDCNQIENINIYDDLPTELKLSKLYLKFPNFSVDQYENGIKYAITINIWLDNINIYLGSYLINHNDALALAPIERYNDNNYFDYINIPIIDPYEIIYSKDWENFRRKLQLNDINIFNSALNISLYPVKLYDNKYLSIDHYIGSQCSFNISSLNELDELKLNLIFDESIRYPKYINKINYNNKFKTFENYIENIYNFKKITDIKIEFIILDKDNIYKIIEKIITPQDEEIIFKKDNRLAKDIPPKENPDGPDKPKIPWKLSEILCFENWQGWHIGMFAKTILSFQGIDNYNSECGIRLVSNEVPFTMDQMRYFIYDQEELNENIDLNTELRDMKILNINAVNKIENKIIYVDKPEEVRTNIINPIFYKTEPLINITLHSEAIENICLNLNSYKSVTKRFNIRFKNISFPEIGRVPTGVIFNINGLKLPKENGEYFIDDENGQTITSGKYIIL